MRTRVAEAGAARRRQSRWPSRAGSSSWWSLPATRPPSRSSSTRSAVWYGTRGGLDQDRVVRGPAQWLEYIGEIQDTWEGLEIEVERAIEVGDRVVALTRETARTRDGALEVRSETAVVLRIREGRIVEARGYLDRDEALRAAGATN